MANPNLVKRDLIEGRPALIVIDIQKGTFINNDDVRAIDHMPDYRDRMALARTAIDKARDCDVPVIFIQEAHRPDHIDFGRELDGDEDVHCVEGAPGTPLAVEEMGITEADYGRAREMAHGLGMTEEGMILIDLQYGRIHPEKAEKRLMELTAAREQKKAEQRARREAKAEERRANRERKRAERASRENSDLRAKAPKRRRRVMA